MEIILQFDLIASGLILIHSFNKNIEAQLDPLSDYTVLLMPEKHI